MRKPLPHPSTHDSELPDNICSVVCKMMAKKPGERYQSAAELLVDVEAILAHNTAAGHLFCKSYSRIKADAQPQSPAKAPYFGTRRVSYALSVGVVLAIALAVSFWIPAPSAPTLSPIADAHTPLLSPITVEDGFEPIFDGKTLDGWDGKKEFWSVQDGAITGETTKETPTGKNTVIIYRKSEVADFELKFDYCILSEGANSGIQYRSEDLGNYVARGYQADFGSGTKYSGILYGELTGRGIMAHRGMRVWLGDGKSPKKTEKFAEAADLQKQIKGQGEWNEYHIIVKGNHFIHKINGHLMTEAHDESADFKAKGILALQLHAGGPMKLQFRNIRLKSN